MIDSLDREQQLTLWCRGALEQLEAWGLLLTESNLPAGGIAAYDQIDAGDPPTDAELYQLSRLEFEEDSTKQKALFCLLKLFLIDRERMRAHCGSEMVLRVLISRSGLQRLFDKLDQEQEEQDS